MNTNITFSLKLNKNNTERMNRWIAQQDQKVAIQQKRDSPHYGSCGGAYTYSFTPTSIGTVCKLTNDLTKESIDITDYDQF